MYRFSFFLISFICSIFLFISPVLADEEIEIYNDFLIEEEIETETQEEVVEEHIEDIEEDLEDEEIVEDIEDNYDDFIDDLMPIDDDIYIHTQADVNDINVGDYILYQLSNNNIYYARVLCLNPFTVHNTNIYYIPDGTNTVTDRLIYYNYDHFAFFRYANLLSTFSSSSSINLDNASIDVDNTQIVEKLDNVLNTFYIMVFIVCTILGFLLAYIFVKMLFKI